MGITGLSNAAWRVVLLLAEAIAPWGAPVEAAEAASVQAAVLRLALAIAVYAAATWGVRRAAARYPGVAALGALALLAAPVLSAVCSGERGPLARGVWVEAPLVWAALAALVAGPVLDAARAHVARRARFLLGAVVVAAGIAGIAAARGTLGTREAMWRSALDARPGDVAASLAMADLADARQERQAAIDAVAACARIDPDACACAARLATDAIDAGRYAQARRALDAADACPRTPRWVALGAEALIGTSALDEGEREAARALERDPNDAHAVYARAWAASLRGRSLVSSGGSLGARADAERAVALGRGIPAQLLLGTILYGAADLPGADALFQRVLGEDPTCAQAAYDHALVADKQSRYHDAREGYLRALQLDPSNADARFNLVVLTHAHGAVMEARHHLEVFQAAYPGDARAGRLAALVAQPPEKKAMTLP